MDAHETVPMVPLRDVVLFPHMMMPFLIGRESSIRALDQALRGSTHLFLAAQRDASLDDPQPADIHTMGCLANIVQCLKPPDGGTKVLVEGVERARAVEWKEDRGFYRVVVKIVPKHEDTGVDAKPTMTRVVSLFEEYVKLSNSLPYDLMNAVVRVDDPGKLADTIAAHLSVGVDEKQNLLEILSPVERLNRTAGILDAEVDKLQVDGRIQSRMKKRMEKAKKEYYIRTRRWAIRSEIDDLKSKIEASDTAPNVRADAAKDLERLEALAKLRDDAISVPEDLEWPGVFRPRLVTHDRPDLTIQTAVGQESGTKESASLSEEQPAHPTSLSTAALFWVAVVAGLIGAGVVVVMQWLVG